MSETNFLNDRNTFSLTDLFYTTSQDVINPNDVSRVYSYSMPNYFNENLLPAQILENIDYSEPLNYIKFSSFEDLIVKSITNIIVNFPSSLHIQTTIVGRDYGSNNITDILYDNENDLTHITIDTDYISNPGGINILSTSTPNQKDFNEIYQDYELFIDSVRYKLTHFQGAERNSNSSIKITVKGKVFDNVETYVNEDFYIVPSADYTQTITDNFSGFEKYLLKRFDIADTYEYEGKRLLYKKYFIIPQYDSFNFDFYTDRYENFLTELLALAKKYDEQDTNIILRLLVPKALINDAYSLNQYDDVIPNKILILSSFIGSYFDTLHERVKKFYNGEPVDYSKISNLYLKKYSGTAWQLKKIFNKYNIPDALIEFSQIVYTTKPINYSVLERVYQQYDIDIINSELPINKDGTPNVQNIKKVFQSNGYFQELENLYPVDEDIFLRSETTETVEYKVFNDIENDNLDIIDYTLTGFTLTNGSCFEITGSVIESTTPQIFLDECGCEIDKTDYAFDFYLKPQNPYDMECAKFVLDVVPTCTVNVITGDPVTGETTCRYEYNILSSDNIGNSVFIEPTLNGLIVSYKTILSASCQEQQQTSYQNVINIYNCYSIENMTVSGYVEEIRLFDTVLNTPIDIDISPSSPYLIGYFHTVDPNDLYFPASLDDIEIWEEAVLKVIENAVYVEFDHLGFPENGIHYFASVKYLNTKVEICFMNKHQPTLPEYNIGVNKFDARVKWYRNGVQYISGYNDPYTDSINIVHTRELCDTLTLNKILYSEDIINATNTNYNEIIIRNDHISLIENGSNTVTECVIEDFENELSVQYLTTLQANIYGGTPPYTLFGIDEDTEYATGVIYTAFVQDANGCLSNTVTGRTICLIDDCNGFAFIERERVTFVEVEIPATQNCVSVPITYSFGVYEEIEGEITQYYYRHDVSPTYIDNLTLQVNISFGLDVETITTTNKNYFAVFESGSPFSGAGTVTVSINMVSDDGCLYALSTHMFDLTLENELYNTNVVATGSTETITVLSGITETYIEYSPIRPTLSAGYTCNDNGTATLNLSVSGGYEPYTFFGGQNGLVVDTNQTLELFVRGADGCESEHVFLTIDCNAPLECIPIRLSAALETTSVTQDDKLSTLTFSYLIEDDDISMDVDEVSVVCTALNAASNYMIGNPVFAAFNIEFGSKQLFFDFNPDDYIPVSIRFYMSIKMDNGCVYTDTFVLDVNPSVLSNTDTYYKELVG